LPNHAIDDFVTTGRFVSEFERSRSAMQLLAILAICFSRQSMEDQKMQLQHNGAREIFLATSRATVGGA